MNKKPIILWSHPRSVSTAFERAFLERKDDIQCFHEPFGEPFYYGPDRMSRRYDEEQCRASGHQEVTFDSVMKTIMRACQTENRRIFIKDMSQYVIKSSLDESMEIDHKRKNPTMFSDDQLRAMEHSFLIRTPEKSVPSYWRCCSGDQAKETGFDTYDPREAGYVESVRLYKYLVSLGLDPIIVDSADLVHTPKIIMKAYCEHVGVPWREGMIEWKAEKVDSFDKWKGFHDDAQKSTGFREVERPKENLPPIVIETIEMNRDPYDYLRSRRLVV